MLENRDTESPPKVYSFLRHPVYQANLSLCLSCVDSVDTFYSRLRPCHSAQAPTSTTLSGPEPVKPEAAPWNAQL